MILKEFGIDVILVGCLLIAQAIDRCLHKRKVLHRLHNKEIHAEALRPKPRNWYRFRSALTLFTALIVSYPFIMPWVFPDVALFSTEILILFGFVALLGAVLYGLWLGDLKLEVSKDAYRAAKEEEKKAQSLDNKLQH